MMEEGGNKNAKRRISFIHWLSALFRLRPSMRPDKKHRVTKRLAHPEQVSGANASKNDQSILSWFAEAKSAQWTNLNHVKNQYSSASILKRGRVVFNIAGNKYRLIVKINYDKAIVYVRFIGTHKEYDEIDPETI